MKKESRQFVIYSRKSKFTGKGESIENQIELCRQYKQTLYVDEEAAEVVRRIFEMAAAGRGISEIADTLTAEKILIPSAYQEKSDQVTSRHHNYHDPFRWNSLLTSSPRQRKLSTATGMGMMRSC